MAAGECRRRVAQPALDAFAVYKDRDAQYQRYPEAVAEHHFVPAVVDTVPTMPAMFNVDVPADGVNVTRQAKRVVFSMTALPPLNTSVPPPAYVTGPIPFPGVNPLAILPPNLVHIFYKTYPSPHCPFRSIHTQRATTLVYENPLYPEYYHICTQMYDTALRTTQISEIFHPKSLFKF